MSGIPRIVLILLALVAAMPGHAQQQAGFDLEGPGLAVTVSRGAVALPLSAVPALREGDRLTVRAVLPEDQSARYRLIVAFLRGATNPPPKDWFHETESWREKRATLALTVPAGAEQALVFLAPEVGGGFEAVRNAVRGRPGVFVRAAQSLHLAGLDQARLDAFVTAIARIGEAQPERLGTAAPVLAKALGIKLNAECLTRPRALQAACLTQNRDTLVLQAQRGSTLTETLTGAPVDLAYRIAATPEGGAGYYSPYIGLARDVARLFGAFRSAQYQYLPALVSGSGETLGLRLNAAPSFQNPRSVLVAPLPPVGEDPLPRFQPAARDAVCLARPGAVLPLEDAALLYATGYARDLHLRATGPDGRERDLPVIADAELGGLRLSGPAGGEAVTGGVLRGHWGFEPFAGPRLPARLDAGDWKMANDGAVVVGREQTLTLTGGAPACIEAIALSKGGGAPKTLMWKPGDADTVQVTLPLSDTPPGPLTLSVARYGTSPPQQIALNGRTEASRIDRLTIHRGDRAAVLTGARLDQVKMVEIGGARFAPDTLSRGEGADRLTLRSEAVPSIEDERATGVVALSNGRSARVTAAIERARPAATILNREARHATPAGAIAIDLPPALVADEGRLAFSMRVIDGPVDAIEIEASEGERKRIDIASGALQRLGNDVVVGALSPHTMFGRHVSGTLRYRVLRGEVASDWAPLATVVRLPTLTGHACAGDRCRLTGRDLFLIAGVSTGMGAETAVPLGFVGDAIDLPAATRSTLMLRLHDTPDTPVTVSLPDKTGG